MEPVEQLRLAFGGFLARLLVGGAKLGGDLRVGGRLVRFASFDRHGRAGYPVVR